MTSNGFLASMARGYMLLALGLAVVLLAGGIGSAAALSPQLETGRIAGTFLLLPRAVAEAPASTVDFILYRGATLIFQWPFAAAAFAVLAVVCGATARRRGGWTAVYWSCALVLADAAAGAAAIVLVLNAPVGVEAYTFSQGDKIAIAAFAIGSGLLLLWVAAIMRPKRVANAQQARPAKRRRDAKRTGIERWREETAERAPVGAAAPAMAAFDQYRGDDTLLRRH